jgi:hypothetical protein
MTTTDTPRTDAMQKRYITVVYEIADETEWRKTNPLRYAHNGLSAVRVSLDDACELLDEAEAEVERLKVINADMRNFLSKAIHNEGFNEEQALKFIYQ